MRELRLFGCFPWVWVNFEPTQKAGFKMSNGSDKPDEIALEFQFDPDHKVRSIELKVDFSRFDLDMPVVINGTGMTMGELAGIAEILNNREVIDNTSPVKDAAPDSV